MRKAVPEPLASPMALSGEGDRRVLEGVLDIRTLAQARDFLGPWLRQHKSRELDLAGLSALDTPDRKSVV